MYVCPKCLGCIHYQMKSLQINNLDSAHVISPACLHYLWRQGLNPKCLFGFTQNYATLFNFLFQTSLIYSYSFNLLRLRQPAITIYHSTAGACGCGRVGGSTGASCGEFFLVSQLTWYISDSISLTVNHGHPSTLFCCSKNHAKTRPVVFNPIQAFKWLTESRSDEVEHIAGSVGLSVSPVDHQINQQQPVLSLIATISQDTTALAFWCHSSSSSCHRWR